MTFRLTQLRSLLSLDDLVQASVVVVVINIILVAVVVITQSAPLAGTA